MQQFDDSRIRMLLRRRADQMIARAVRINVLRMADLSHESCRVQMGVSVDAYRRARRWLRITVARCVACPEPMSISDGLHEFGGEIVANALRIGALERDGVSHQDVRRMLKLADDEWDEAFEWHRDATALVLDED